MPQPESPWFAVNLSLLLPGLGQLHQGQVLRGLLWLGSSLGLLGVMFWAYLAAHGNVQIGAGALGMGVMLWAMNLVDAHACASGGQRLRFESFSLSQGTAASGTTAQPAELEGSGAVKRSPAGYPSPDSLQKAAQDPWFSLFLSQIFPGLGHLQRRQWLSGALFLTLGLFCSFVWVRQLGFVLGLPTLTAFACAGLGLSLGQHEAWQRKSLGLAMAVFLSRALFFGTFPAVRQVVEPFVVPSESMFPTLMVGDRILVHKTHRYLPQRGDIVVFRDPTQPEDGKQPRFFVKRIVGGPGDRIKIAPGLVQRNGQPLIEPYTQELPHYVWDSGEIPARHFVVLGDNRNESFDSSKWGFLPRSKILGRAYRISWPPERNQPL